MLLPDRSGYCLRVRADRIWVQISRTQIFRENTVDHIVPRWEWRTFRTNFGLAEESFAALAPEKVQSSSEIYLLDADSDANIK